MVKEFPFNGLLLRLEGALVEIDRKTAPFQMKRPSDKKELPAIGSEFGLRLNEIVDFAEKRNLKSSFRRQGRNMGNP